MEKGMRWGDGKGNLEINYQRDVFKCWVCKETNDMYGSITRLIKRYGTPKNLKDYDLVKPDVSDTREYKKTVNLKLPEGYKRLTDATFKDFKYNAAMEYLTTRGITPEVINKYDIGFCSSGKFFNRIIIPSYDLDQKLNYFVARWFDKVKVKNKYMNPEAEKQAIVFNEGRINWDATIYLVEGATDHIVVPNSIPLLGKFISEVLRILLDEKAKANVVILLDGDALEDALLLYNDLNFGALKGRVKICHPPAKYDPSKINELRGRDGIVKLLKRTGTPQELKERKIIE
jgi:DNA primase